MKRKSLTQVSWITFLVSAISEWGLDIDLPLTPALWLVMAAVVFFATNAPAALTTNSWIISGDGLWHVGLNWSLGVTPSSNQTAVLITNAATKTVIINNLSAGLSGVMTISNLTVRGVETNNTLFLNSSGTSVPLRILNGFTLGTNAVLRVTNSVLRVDGLSGGELSIDGDATNLAGGQIITTNSTIRVGNFDHGSLNLVGGSLLGSDIWVGAQAGSQGTLTVAGGTNTLTGNLLMGALIDATGAVWLTGGQLTVTNGFTEVGEFAAGRMTVSNGTWLAQDVLVGANTGSQGTLTVAGGTNTLTAFLKIANSIGATGAVWLTGGQLTMTNAFTEVGAWIGGAGRMTVSNGTWLARDVLVGFSGGGTLTVAGGTNSLLSLAVAVGVGSTGAVWVTGGQLTVTNLTSDTVIGDGGVGQMTVSNGTWRSSDVVVGANAGSQGTLTVAGGTNTLSVVDLIVGNDANANGAVWVTGGQWTMTNGTAWVGNDGVGRMTVSNGTWLARNVNVGASQSLGPTGRGTLTIAGGTNAVSSNMILGNFACTSTGTVVVAGGDLFVTNAITNAVLDVRSGTLILNSGVLTVDRLVMTNACATFVHTGGTLVYGTAVLDPARDDDGDGLPNGWEQDYGLDPLDPSGSNGAAGDPDGDGQNNLAEYQAGTVPTVDIKSIAREGNNIRVTWQAAATRTNALQATAGGVGGNYSTNSFVDIFIVTNNVGSVTNYLDVGGATNFPARYYRIRLVP